MRPPNIPFTPGARPRSTKRVEKPLRARLSAAAEPAGPAPTTMASKRSTFSRAPRWKSGTGKRLSAGSRHRHRLQLEFAPIVPLRHAGNLLAQELLAHEQAGDPRHPAREEVTHRLLRWPVRRGDWAVVPRDREATSLRVEVDDLGPSPPGERGRVNDSLRSLQRQGQ